MRILALDTTTRAGSVAVVEDDRVMAEYSGDPARSHAERLPTDVRTPAASRNNYAWDPSGRRVLMNVPVTRPEAVRIVVTVPRRPATR